METILRDEDIGAFAPVRIQHRAGSAPITPASAIVLTAVSRYPDRFHGIGIDWGCGTGCIAIVLAKNPAVQRVVALDVSEDDIATTRENVALNGVADRVTVLRADSFRPLTAAERSLLEELRGRVDFVVANPPGSTGDDGFGFRKRIATEVGSLLRADGRLFLQISVQYGDLRIRSLAATKTRLRYEGLLASTDWVLFDLEREDLRTLLAQYVAEERRGAFRYKFGDPRTHGATHLTATEAQDIARRDGWSPLTRWQVHEYVYDSPIP